MPKTPRGKRVPDASGDSFVVVNKAPNGEAEPYFDKSRGVWVAPWRKPDGRVGRPTGKTRARAVASRDPHAAKALHEAQFGELADGFTADTTVGELSAWVAGTRRARPGAADLPRHVPKACGGERRQARLRARLRTACRAGDGVRLGTAGRGVGVAGPEP